MTTCYHVRFIQWSDAFPETNTTSSPKCELPSQSWVNLTGYEENEIEDALIETLERAYKYKIDKIYWERARLWGIYR